MYKITEDLTLAFPACISGSVLDRVHLDVLMPHTQSVLVPVRSVPLNCHVLKHRLLTPQFGKKRKGGGGGPGIIEYRGP